MTSIPLNFQWVDVSDAYYTVMSEAYNTLRIQRNRQNFASVAEASG